MKLGTKWARGEVRSEQLITVKGGGEEGGRGGTRFGGGGMVGCEVSQKDGWHMQSHRRGRRLTKIVSRIWTPGRATTQWGSLPCARSPHRSIEIAQ